MKIIVETKRSELDAMRRAGYGFLKQDAQSGEFSFTKRAGGSDYPRFHAYVKKEKGVLIINLHLDQKRPSYSGSHAHNAEYDGEMIENEMEIIKKTAI